MICPDAYVIAAAKKLSPALVSAQALTRIAAVPAQPDCATGHILEVRLGEADGAVDLSKAYLASSGGLVQLAESARIDGDLAPLAPFLDAATRADGLAIPLIWLEYDLNGDQPGSPSIFFTPPDPNAPSEAAVALVRTALTQLPVSPQQIEATADLTGRLPLGVGVRQVGVMIPRAPRVVRLVLHGVDAAGLPALLRGVNWPGDLAAADRLAQHPALAGARLRADLDILDGVAPGLGVEIATVTMTPPRIRAVIADLAADGLILPAAADALAELATPITLTARIDRDATSGLEGRVELRLNHLKAQLSPKGGVSVKAYLSLVATPVFPDGRARAQSERVLHA